MEALIYIMEGNNVLSCSAPFIVLEESVAPLTLF